MKKQPKSKFGAIVGLVFCGIISLMFFAGAIIGFIGHNFTFAPIVIFSIVFGFIFGFIALICKAKINMINFERKSKK